MLDINLIIEKLKEKRPIFVSEADFQFTMAWVIQKLYPNALIRLEYCPADFDTSMHIDILVIVNGRWIPIELKYKTKRCIKEFNKEKFILKNHGAIDCGCYDYLKDIARIEKVKSNTSLFEEGYAIMLTNDMSYVSSTKDTAFYKNFSLENDSIKTGAIKWLDGVGVGTTKGRTEDILLSGNYQLCWQDYSKLDNTNTGRFKLLISKVQ